MALLAAAIAVAAVLLFYVHRAPAPKAPAPAPPSASARPASSSPIPPPASTATLPTTTTTTTTTSAVASGPAIGEPCNDWSKIARDPNTGLTIICDGATGAGAAPPHWTTDDLSHAISAKVRTLVLRLADRVQSLPDRHRHTLSVQRSAVSSNAATTRSGLRTSQTKRHVAANF
jgi:hypothetical protein